MTYLNTSDIFIEKTGVRDMRIEDLRYYCGFIKKEIYKRYRIDQVAFLNGNMIFHNDFIMLKLNLDIPKSIEYSIGLQDFKLLYNVLPSIKSIDFYRNSIILNKEDLIIPNKIDDFFYALDAGIDGLIENKELKYDLSAYNYMLKWYDAFYGTENLKYVMLTERNIHFIRKDFHEIRVLTNNSKHHDGFPIAFDSLSLTRFLNLARHFKSDIYINFEYRMLMFDNGIQKGLLIGSQSS